MPTTERLRLVLHGAIVLMIGLLCGLPTVVESTDGAARHWHTAHEALIMVGVWLLAESSVIPLLKLESRELTALVWSLLMLAYGFTAALILAAIANAEAFAPGDTPATIAAFVTAVIGILGAVGAAGITIMGASAALKGSRAP
jgi:hypothetical protein